MPRYDYDLFVIGGGSGGVRAARLAAGLGRRVAIAEEYRIGGTCVIRGCVPKKLLVYASQFAEHFEDSRGYGWSAEAIRFDWPTLIENKDREIARLERAYRGGLERAGAEIHETRAELADRHTVVLADGGRVTAERILIATGGRPNPHDALPGHELCITSNEAFHLPDLPRSVLIGGGGFIAMEFANIFHGLGVETTLLYRGKEILGRFDMDLRRGLHEAMEAKGIRIVCHDWMSRVERSGDGRLKVQTIGGAEFGADQVMLAIGRVPNTKGLGLENAGVDTDALGAIVVDEFSLSSADNIWAVGDVTNRLQLTPVAIHEAMCFIETAFRDNPTKPDHDTVAAAVFSQPEIGTVGLSEDRAAEEFEDVEIYRTAFRPMRHTLSGRQEKMMMKLVVDGSTRRVLGAHILGPDAGELAQVLGIAVKAGLTKDDFDRTMAIHPTAAEELVTLYEPTYRLKNGERV